MSIFFTGQSHALLLGYEKKFQQKKTSLCYTRRAEWDNFPKISNFSGNYFDFSIRFCQKWRKEEGRGRKKQKAGKSREDGKMEKKEYWFQPRIKFSIFNENFLMLLGIAGEVELGKNMLL
jgi:hypothetical protein